jgi:tRNA pseudouridine55 synthase
MYNIYKNTGLTPFQVVNRFKKEYPKYKNKKIAYAGRLDPLAHGVLLLLVEPETKNAKKYQNLDKEYEFEVLFGVETDTYDILGKIRNPNISCRSRPCFAGETLNNFQISKFKIQKISNEFLGKYKQPYPPFSSKTVKGKPLFWWAREGKLKDIKLPSKEVEIYSLELISKRNMDIKLLSYQFTKKIKSVNGNFRQKAIMKDWKNFFKNTKQKEFPIVKFRIHCSSGTYVRQIAHEMGQMLCCGAIAYDILRTRVGEYKLEESIKL